MPRYTIIQGKITRHLKENIYDVFISWTEFNFNYLQHCYFGSQYYKVFGQKFYLYREG